MPKLKLKPVEVKIDLESRFKQHFNEPYGGMVDTYTASQANKELLNFKFKGIGWYLDEIGNHFEAVLVLPIANKPRSFRIFSFCEDPRATMQEMLNLPVVNHRKRRSKKEVDVVDEKGN